MNAKRAFQISLATIFGLITLVMLFALGLSVDRRFGGAAAEGSRAVIGNVLAWGLGYIFTLMSLRSADQRLFALTPLTPQLYFRRNVSRFAIPAFGLFAIFPAVMMAILAGQPRTPETIVPLTLAFALVLLLFWLVPLAESLGGMVAMRWFFLPRTVFRLALAPLRAAGWSGSFTLVMLLILGLRWIAPAIGRFDYALLDRGAPGWLALFALFPVEAIFQLAATAQAAGLLWIVAGLLATFAAYCLTHIARGMRVMPRDLDEDAHRDWTDRREGIEEAEQEWSEAQERDAPVWGNIYEDGFEAMEDDADYGRIDRTATDYDETLAPEEQLRRQARLDGGDALAGDEGPLALVIRGVAGAFGFATTHFWLTAVSIGWAVHWIYGGRRPVVRLSFDMDRVLIAGTLIVAMLAGLFRAEAMFESIGRASTLPMRWAQWLTVARGRIRVYLWGANALAAALIVTCARADFLLFPLLLLALQAVHLDALCDREIAVNTRAGRSRLFFLFRLPPALLGAVLIVPVLVIGGAPFPMELILAAICCPLIAHALAARAIVGLLRETGGAQIVAGLGASRLFGTGETE